MDANETINDRIQMLVDKYFDGNKAAFAKQVGLHPTGLSNYLHKRSKPGYDLIKNIVTHLNVDANWFITGQYKKTEQLQQADELNKLLGERDEEIHQLKSILEDVNKENKELKISLLTAQTEAKSYRELLNDLYKKMNTGNKE